MEIKVNRDLNKKLKIENLQKEHFYYRNNCTDNLYLYKGFKCVNGSRYHSFIVLDLNLFILNWYQFYERDYNDYDYMEFRGEITIKTD